MKKVLVIIGTRPEAIKMAPVIRALRERPEVFQSAVCVTGQHRQLLDQVITHFNFRVDYDLNLMRKDQRLSDLTSAIMSGIQEILDTVRPDCLLVQGDTTTAFVGALAGYYNHIQVGHVEAGLRTYNKLAPFPEEINRRLVGTLADHHFAPTQRARLALLAEGIDEARILVTGNTVVDALLQSLERIEALPPSMGNLEPLLTNGSKIVLITGHRRENFGEGFRNMCEAIRMLSEDFKDFSFVYPVHLNPNVQKPVHQLLGKLVNVHLVPPLEYARFVRLMSKAYLVLTDSGGIQEEAPTFGKPVLVMREVTERPEGVEAGAALLVGTDKRRILTEAAKLMTDTKAYQSMSQAKNPYGDGNAAARIVDYLITH